MEAAARDFLTGVSTVVPYKLPPTRADVAIADMVSRYTTWQTEEIAKVVTWGADEHLMLALAAAWWLYSCRGSRRRRRTANHLMLTAIAVSVIPHLVKSVVDQQRPDRSAVRGRLHGVPLSGNADDAFPSGHAMHVGALASAASELPAAQRNTVWAIAAGLALSRIVLLAHWTSDVIAGLALGVVTERWLRRLTGYGMKKPRARSGQGLSRSRRHEVDGTARRAGGSQAAAS